MEWKNEPGLLESISGWISDAVAPAATSPSQMREAMAQGLIGRINALGGALSFARRGNPEALGAVRSLARRIRVMATVYALEEIRRAAGGIDDGCRDVQAGVERAWGDVDLAFATLEGVARSAPRARMTPVAA